MAEEKKYPPITPKDVTMLKTATNCFLCPLEANIYGIVFGKFTIRDMQTNKTLLSVEPIEGVAAMVDDNSRLIRYSFSKEFLRLKTIGTTVEFKVGSKDVTNFRMIERHYFRDKLLQSYDFTFGYCIPKSSNTWELIYTLPQLSEEEIEEMVKHPFEAKSDSFYFVENKLFMHHKAQYEYLN